MTRNQKKQSQQERVFLLAAIILLALLLAVILGYPTKRVVLRETANYEQKFTNVVCSTMENRKKVVLWTLNKKP